MDLSLFSSGHFVGGRGSTPLNMPPVPHPTGSGPGSGKLYLCPVQVGLSHPLPRALRSG